MNTSETKVDVLAVMDAAASRSQERAASIGGDSWIHQQSADAMRQARAAVAELIEAADKLQRIYHLMDTDPDFIRLRAALSRIGGAK